MPSRPLSTASDVTIIDLTDAQANELQSEVTKSTEFATPSISQLRIFVYDKTGANATRLDRSGTEDKSGHARAFYDTMRKALLMTVGVYLSKKGTKTLKTMADIWIKANMKTPSSTAVDKAVKAWQKELQSGNLPPVIASWQETKDGRTFASGKPPSSLKGTDKSLDSMTITLNGPMCWLAYWESNDNPITNKKYPVESGVRFFWLLTVIIHEFAHTFEFFLAWFYTDLKETMPKEFKASSKDKEAEIGWWMEVQLLGGTLSNGDDRTGRDKKLRAGVPILLWEHNGTPKESTEDFKHLQELEKAVTTGKPAKFDDTAFPESFQLGSPSNQSAYVSTGAVDANAWWKEIKTAPLKGYNPDKKHDTDPGIKTPAPITKSIELYSRKDTKPGYFLNRQGHLRKSSKSAGRPHMYQEDGHHYISHHPDHKELWRHATEASETEEDGEEDDGDGEDEEGENGEEQTEDEEEANRSEDLESEVEPEKDGADESEPEPPKKVSKKPKVKGEGESQSSTRLKAPPKKLYRFGQEKLNEGQKGAHNQAKKASDGGESKLATRPKAPPKKLKRSTKENNEETE